MHICIEETYRHIYCTVNTTRFGSAAIKAVHTVCRVQYDRPSIATVTLLVFKMHAAGAMRVQ